MRPDASVNPTPHSSPIRPPDTERPAPAPLASDHDEAGPTGPDGRGDAAITLVLVLAVAVALVFTALLAWRR
jgi:hypothetical protein